jgi:hypothetical protein
MSAAGLHSAPSDRANGRALAQPREHHHPLADDVVVWFEVLRRPIYAALRRLAAFWNARLWR